MISYDNLIIILESILGADMNVEYPIPVTQDELTRYRELTKTLEIDNPIRLCIDEGKININGQQYFLCSGAYSYDGEIGDWGFLCYVVE